MIYSHSFLPALVSECTSGLRVPFGDRFDVWCHLEVALLSSARGRDYDADLLPSWMLFSNYLVCCRAPYGGHVQASFYASIGFRKSIKSLAELPGKAIQTWRMLSCSTDVRSSACSGLFRRQPMMHCVIGTVIDFPLLLRRCSLSCP